jgi:hypothetical protein
VKQLSSNEIKLKWDKDRIKLGNSLYADLSHVLANYEARGFNSHARTQHLVESLLKDADYWIDIQINAWRMDSTRENTKINK